MFLENKFLARARRASLRQKRVPESGKILQLIHLPLPLSRDGRRDEETFAAVADRRLEQFRKGQLAKFLMELDPRRHGTRHCNRVPAALWHRLLAPEIVVRPGCR